ncbi:MAG: endonuclease MutS2 [Myxococcales bacterium]|nr:endonuclease MutS2 [Myxococcales bacterium]
MAFDPATLASLGFEEVRRRLAALCLTPGGAAEARHLAPRTDTSEIRRDQQCLKEALALERQGLALPIEPVEEIGADLERAEKGGVLTPAAVLRVARAMAVTSRVRRFLLSGGGRGEALASIARQASDLMGPGEDLAQAFDAQGLLRDSASPQLFALRDQARRIAERIRGRLEALVNGRLAGSLMEPIVTLRQERFVLPVRSEARAAVPGIVHDVSGSGATLFIEPAEMVEDGNRLTIARAAALDEEARILAEYSREIAERAPALRASLEALARLDVLRAKAILAARWDGVLPELGAETFELLAARHPLMALDGPAPVANDIRLPRHARGLLITGPNAGGKTVTLKTAGLCALLAQAGFAIPAADGSRLPVFRELAAVIGDEQDLGRGLSTFSSHLERLRDILARADPDTLALVDEIAADTEPRHGAALARAVCEALAERGAWSFVTTHFEELKALPAEDARFANASVGFDVEHLAPTFVLHPDVPGRSLTLPIARRHGLPEEIVRRAESLLAQEEHRLDGLLASLESERLALQQARDGLHGARQEIERERQRLSDERGEFESRLRQRVEQERHQALDEIRRARREAAALLEELRRTPSVARASQAGARLKDLESSLSPPASPAAEPAQDGDGPGDFQPGDRVTVLPLGRTGEVTAVDRRTGMLSVQLGSMGMRVPFEQARREPAAAARPGKQPGAGRPAPSSPAPADGAPDPLRHADNTLDLRGLRVDEALAAVEAFLDRLYGAGEAAAFLLHGHGTGALKSAVRNYLRRSPYAKRHEPAPIDQGGDGVTVVRLR